jgi:DNA repair protein RecO
MYHVYTTTGIILASYPRGDSARHYRILTCDMGLVGATAQGVRLLKSKLRYSLQDLSQIEVSMVRGKQGWHITSAVCQKSFYSPSRERQQAVMRVVNLFTRLLAVESPDPKLFTLLRDGLELLSSASFTPSLAQAVEGLLVYRILHQEGYIGESDLPVEFADLTEWQDSTLNQAAVRQRALVVEINKALAVI